MSGDTNVHRVVGNLLVGTSHFFVDTTTNRVGVNTSSPSASLDVATGDLKVGSDITIGNSGTITAANFSGNGSGLSDINSDSGSWVKDDANSKIYVANSAHKVAIGTTSASELLTVGNDGVNADVVNNIRLNGRKASADGEICGLYFANSKDTGDGTTGSSASIRASRIGGNNFATQLDFYTNDGVAVGSGTSRLTILGSGNVGLGTSSPGSDKLRIDVGNITSDTVILNTRAQYASSNFGYLQIKEVNHTPSSTNWNGWSTRIQKVVDVTQHGYIEFNPAGDPYGIAFGNDGGSGAGEVMRIDGITGRVGIGRTDPTRELDVAGDINLNGVGRTIYFDATGGSGLYWGGGFSRIVDDGNLRICTDDVMHFNTGCGPNTLGTERMRIASDGKILLQGFEVKQQIIGYLSSRFGSAYSYDWAPSGNQNTWKDTKVINYTRKKAGTKIMVRFTACTSKAIADNNYRASYLRVESRLKITTANGAVSYSSALGDWNRSDYGFFEAENLRYDFFDAGTLSGSSANQNISFTFQVLGTANNGYVGRFGLNLWASNTPISGIEVYEIINE